MKFILVVTIDFAVEYVVKMLKQLHFIRGFEVVPHLFGTVETHLGKDEGLESRLERRKFFLRQQFPAFAPTMD
jgi:hypothetical protein